MYKCKIITYCSYFEPVFQGEKSRLFILQQCIIYLNYLIADTSLKNQAQYNKERSRVLRL